MICKLYLHKALQKKKENTWNLWTSWAGGPFQFSLNCAGPDPPLLGPGELFLQTLSWPVFFFSPDLRENFVKLQSPGAKSNFLFTIKSTESGSADNAFFSLKSGVKEQVSSWQIRKEIGRGQDIASAFWLGAKKALLFRTCVGQAVENRLGGWTRSGSIYKRGAVEVT